MFLNRLEYWYKLVHLYSSMKCPWTTGNHAWLFKVKKHTNLCVYLIRLHHPTIARFQNPLNTKKDIKNSQTLCSVSLLYSMSSGSCTYLVMGFTLASTTDKHLQHLILSGNSWMPEGMRDIFINQHTVFGT